MYQYPKLEQWLDSKVNDKTILIKEEINKNSIPHYQSQYAKSNYYTNDDTDLKSNNELMFDIINNTKRNKLDKYLLPLSQYMDHILLYPNTNRYHANYLFRKLIDTTKNNNYIYNNEYNEYNEETNNYKSINLIDISLKKAFYKFCYDNTIKK